MYRIDDEKTYYMLLPPNLQDIDAECFSYALAKQIKKLVPLAKKLNVWGNLDGLDPKYYDLAAACMNAQYYRTKYPNEIKLELIKHAYEMHRFAGTQTAIDTLLNIVFENTQFIPWHQYDGKPYHFKVLVYDVLTEDAVELFTDVLKKVKAARSVLDTIDIGREAAQSVHFAAVTVSAGTGEKIIEDANAANGVTQAICTGATTTHYASTQKIAEEWGKDENESTEKRYTAERTGGAEKAPAILEDNDQDADVAKVSMHTQAETGMHQKNPGIAEDCDESNDIQSAIHAAHAALETYSNTVN